MNGSVREARGTDERITTALEKLSTGEMMEIFGRGSPLFLGETPGRPLMEGRCLA